MAIAIIQDSIKSRILSRIETRLRTIHPDNGYQLTIPTITRGGMSPLGFQRYPVCMIIPGNDDPEAGASSVNRRLWSIVLRLWVRPHSNLSEELERLISNVQVAMMVDVRWSDENNLDQLAENTMEGETIYIYMEANNTEAGADIEYNIHYRTKITDPTSSPG